MFALTPEACRYIRKHGGHVIISLTFEPSLGGTCKGDRIWGSYVPKIDLGKPIQAENFLQECCDDMTIWYHHELKVKEGYDAVRIYTRTILGHTWLEMEGARGYAVLPPRTES